MSQQWIYARRPQGELTEDCYQLKPLELANSLSRQEVRVTGRYYSVDPYMRIQQSSGDTWEAPFPVGTVQGGAVVAVVDEVADDVSALKPGDWVETYMGWQTHAIRSVSDCRKLDPDQAEPSTALHVLGMPGRIAYFGLLEAGLPKPGDTLVVSGAAGAVGSIVGQIGRLAGCRVIGIAGDQDKANWLTETLGFDEAIVYREHPTQREMEQALDSACPGGIDIYYDNVGGYLTDAVITRMNLHARLVICGQISQYQGGLDSPAMGPRLLQHFLYKRATLTGVLARDTVHRHEEMVARMAPWVAGGQIHYQETIIEGFEQLPKALCSLFEGANTGKLIVTV